jgi:hypothetical protein
MGVGDRPPIAPMVGSAEGRRSNGREAARRRRMRILILLAPILLATTLVEPSYGETSFWQRTIAKDAPTDANSAAIMSYIKSHSTGGYVALSGTTESGMWGTPIYRSAVGDPEYSVRNTCRTHRPPEFASVRIPTGAQPDPTSDASMVVIDSGRGKAYALWHAAYDRESKTWSSCGGTVYYLASNRLAGTLKQSDEPRNYGHRGVPPDIFAVTWSEIQSGHIDHILRIAVDQTRCRHVFPMAGDECGTSNADAPPEGSIIRIKAWVNLWNAGLSKPALVIARALQRYGAVISDQTSGPTELKVENTVAEGRGWLWKGVLTSTSLSKIPLSWYEIVKLGYGS